MEIIREEFRAAQRTHTCNFCRGKIDSGEEYLSTTTIQDGSLYEFKSHTYCNKLFFLFRMYDNYGNEDGVDEDSFEDFIKEEFKFEFPNFGVEGYTTNKIAKLLYENNT